MKKKVLFIIFALAIQVYCATELYAHGDPMVFFRITGAILLYILVAIWLIITKKISAISKLLLVLLYVCLSLLSWNVILSSVNPHLIFYILLYVIPVAIICTVYILFKRRCSRS
jgi:hypothetical protein